MVARSGNPETENILSVFFFTLRFHSAYMCIYVNTREKCFASASFSVQELKCLERLQIFSNFSLTWNGIESKNWIQE